MVFVQTRSPNNAKQPVDDTASLLIVPITTTQNSLPAPQSQAFYFDDLDPSDTYGLNIGAPAEKLTKNGMGNVFQGERFGDIMPQFCGFQLKKRDLDLIEAVALHGQRDYQIDLAASNGIIRATPQKIFGIDLPRSTINQTAGLMMAQAADNGCQSIANCHWQHKRLGHRRPLARRDVSWDCC